MRSKNVDFIIYGGGRRSKLSHPRASYCHAKALLIALLTSLLTILMCIPTFAGADTNYKTITINDTPHAMRSYIGSGKYREGNMASLSCTRGGSGAGTVFGGWHTLDGSTYSLVGDGATITPVVSADMAYHPLDKYTITLQARYENADGTWTDYSVIDTQTKLYGATYAYTKDADDIYKAASLNFTVTKTETKQIDIYRNTFTVELVRGDNIKSVSGAGTYRVGQIAECKATVYPEEWYEWKGWTGTSSESGISFTTTTGGKWRANGKYIDLLEGDSCIYENHITSFISSHRKESKQVGFEVNKEGQVYVAAGEFGDRNTYVPGTIIDKGSLIYNFELAHLEPTTAMDEEKLLKAYTKGAHLANIINYILYGTKEGTRNDCHYGSQTALFTDTPVKNYETEFDSDSNKVFVRRAASTSFGRGYDHLTYYSPVLTANYRYANPNSSEYRMYILQDSVSAIWFD